MPPASTLGEPAALGRAPWTPGEETQRQHLPAHPVAGAGVEGRMGLAKGPQPAPPGPGAELCKVGLPCGLPGPRLVLLPFWDGCVPRSCALGRVCLPDLSQQPQHFTPVQRGNIKARPSGGPLSPAGPSSLPAGAHRGQPSRRPLPQSGLWSRRCLGKTSPTKLCSCWFLITFVLFAIRLYGGIQVSKSLCPVLLSCLYSISSH